MPAAGPRPSCWREVTGGERLSLEGAGHVPMAREPVAVNRAIGELPRPAGAAGPCTGGTRCPPGARSGCCTCPRRSGWATAAATWRSPTSCAAQRARPAGRLAGPAAADRVAATARRVGAPGVGVPRQRGGAHRRARRRARPARVPGDPRDGRDPGRQLHGVQRDRRAGALRPLGRRRGLGARPLPAREPRAEDDGVRVDDRLRRLAADDRGLPGRPSSPPTTTRRCSTTWPGCPASATARCSWATRRTSSPPRSGPACPTSGTGRRRTTTSPAT